MYGMENDIKILTIAIPTYNRIEQIQKQVRLLLPQLVSEVKKLPYMIIILIFVFQIYLQMMN